MIPLVDLKWQNEQIAADLFPVLERVIGSTAFTLGDGVSRFEEEFAAFSDVTRCVGVANGTDALELALRALQLGADAEVLVPTNSFIASAAAVVHAGYRPVLVDVEERSLLIDLAAAERAITERTRAIMPVHLFGQLVDMHAVGNFARQHSLRIIEDAAQSHGARATTFGIGSLSDVAATSFYPGKNLGAFGDAGAVLTNDLEIASHVRMLRDHGSDDKYHHRLLGRNSRLDAVQAAVLSLKLQHLDEWNALRLAAARRYSELLAGFEGVRTPELVLDGSHVWHIYALRLPQRDSVHDAMRAEAVGVGIHYPIPIHRQLAMTPYVDDSQNFPVADNSADQLLSLPIYPGISEEQQICVAACLAKAML